MRKQLESPVHRSKAQRADDGKQEIWPLSAREFMKRPSSELLAIGRHIQWTRLSPPDPAA